MYFICICQSKYCIFEVPNWHLMLICNAVTICDVIHLTQNKSPFFSKIGSGSIPKFLPKLQSQEVTQNDCMKGCSLVLQDPLPILRTLSAISRQVVRSCGVTLWILRTLSAKFAGMPDRKPDSCITKIRGTLLNSFTYFPFQKSHPPSPFNCSGAYQMRIVNTIKNHPIQLNPTIISKKGSSPSLFSKFFQGFVGYMRLFH